MVINHPAVEDIRWKNISKLSIDELHVLVNDIPVPSFAGYNLGLSEPLHEHTILPENLFVEPSSDDEVFFGRHLTEAEKIGLKEVSKIIQDRNLKFPAGVLNNVLRCYRDSKQDAEETVRVLMAKYYMIARVMEGVSDTDEYLRANIDSGFLYWHGRDHEGHPILMLRFGRMIIDQPTIEIVRYIIWTLEYCISNLLLPSRVERWVQVVDLEGASMPPMEMLTSMTSTLSAVYRFRSFKTYLCNAPWIAHGVFKMLQPLLPDVRNKVFFVSKSKMAKIAQENFDLSNVEEDFGGTATPVAKGESPYPYRFYPTCLGGSKFAPLPTWNGSKPLHQAIDKAKHGYVLHRGGIFALPSAAAFTDLKSSSLIAFRLTQLGWYTRRSQPVDCEVPMLNDVNKLVELLDTDLENAPGGEECLNRTIQRGESFDIPPIVHVGTCEIASEDAMAKMFRALDKWEQKQELLKKSPHDKIHNPSMDDMDINFESSNSDDGEGFGHHDNEGDNDEVGVDNEGHHHRWRRWKNHSTIHKNRQDKPYARYDPRRMMPKRWQRVKSSRANSVHTLDRSSTVGIRGKKSRGSLSTPHLEYQRTVPLASASDPLDYESPSPSHARKSSYASAEPIVSQESFARPDAQTADAQSHDLRNLGSFVVKPPTDKNSDE